MDFVLRHDPTQNFANHSAGQQYLDFHKSAATSSGLVISPGFIFFKAASISSTVMFWTGPRDGAVEGMARIFHCRDFLKVIAPSLQCLLAVHEKMAVVIIDAERPLDVLGLPMAILWSTVG
ncbi:unnamed protein product [Heligmosomoides polygyrus]|uniref:Dirigent protein n=1 Tax=Heligmosomoides polygyrus TaxID=6339 RepID=A0A183F8G0_HELPZ|nr:unnamed protein product [Heligmosomoides polygyrus]